MIVIIFVQFVQFVRLEKKIFEMICFQPLVEFEYKLLDGSVGDSLEVCARRR